jgi:hypothetical protein
MRPTVQLDLLDAAIVVAMGARPAGIFTYAVRKIVEHEHGYAGITAATIRRRLERMERAGTVLFKRWGPGCHNEWRKTTCGIADG